MPDLAAALNHARVFWHGPCQDGLVIPLRGCPGALLAIPLALAAGLSVPAGEVRLPSLEQGLKESAPRVLAYLRDGTKHKP
jgi:hypothetical protein